ncbi:MAG: hemolysin [Bacteroidetes bacterium GWF2_38_335]|nr:MAG: hemolysin [Bacteroidetes bacterium GWF2_38_335]OFY77942.1 MAG: hemolysin [Bacteroidetes bacterium RIFOXYA12_FULL_38_20]HBS86683.1 hemolysin [Bacteroidales bacterium]
MKDIISPIPKDVLEKELTEDKFMRTTNYGGNVIYKIDHHNSPNVMLEIGRLRELTFRAAGGGTGKDADIDEYDTMENPYQQLIVWDPDNKEILGGYRYILCDNLSRNPDGSYKLATTGLLKLSEEFEKDFLPSTIELGRSFVQPAYQATSASRRGMFALDNLWDGLGVLVADYPDMKYFFGKVTMYLSYNKLGRDLILYFFKKHMGDKNNLIVPIKPLPFHHDEKELEAILHSKSFQEDFKILSQKVRSLGENIPPLINTYINTSPTMVTFGTSLNDHFGDVEETGILITISDIYPQKKDRHIKTYLEQKKK